MLAVKVSEMSSRQVWCTSSRKLLLLMLPCIIPEPIMQCVNVPKSLPKEKASAAAPLSGDGPVQMRPETGCQQRCSQVDASKVRIRKQTVCLSLWTICVSKAMYCVARWCLMQDGIIGGFCNDS